jgi:hypothetical protein
MADAAPKTEAIRAIEASIAELALTTNAAIAGIATAVRDIGAANAKLGEVAAQGLLTALGVVASLPDDVDPHASPEHPTPQRVVPIADMAALRAYFAGTPLPGDLLELADGKYSGDTLTFNGTAIGTTAALPIIIKAKNPLGAVFTDFPKVSVSAGTKRAKDTRTAMRFIGLEHVTLIGMRFDTCCLALERTHGFRFIRCKGHRNPGNIIELTGPINGGEIAYSDMTIAAFSKDDFFGEVPEAVVPFSSGTKGRRCIEVITGATEVLKLNIHHNFFHHIPPKGIVGSYDGSVCGPFSSGESAPTATTSLKWVIHHNLFYKGYYGVKAANGSMAKFVGAPKSKSVDCVYAYNTYIEWACGVDYRQGYHTISYAEYFDGHMSNRHNGGALNVYAGDVTMGRGDPGLVDYHMVVGAFMRRCIGIRVVTGQVAPPEASKVPMVDVTYPATGVRLIACTLPKYLLGEYGFPLPAAGTRLHACTYTTADSQTFGQGESIVGPVKSVANRIALGKSQNVEATRDIPADWFKATRLEQLGITKIPGQDGQPAPYEIPLPKGTDADQVGPFAAWLGDKV